MRCNYEALAKVSQIALNCRKLRIIWEEDHVAIPDIEDLCLPRRRRGRVRGFCDAGTCARQTADQDRVRDGRDRAAPAERQVGTAAQEIWAEEINAKGGLLGRPVQLVYYDDQTNPATVPGIYTKLLDVDKVDRRRRLRHEYVRAGDADRHAAQNSCSSVCSASP